MSLREILCVDGDAGARLFLEQALTEHDTVFAPSAFEALRLANARPFHAYVLEYWLADWSGPALCRAIRKADPHAPILFCTAAVRETDRARALRAGANAFLRKPIDAQELRSRLSVFLNISLVRSLSAKAEEERAIQEELQRQLSHARMRMEGAEPLSALSSERMAKVRARKAFIEAGGIRTHFESWWPQMFSSARADLQSSAMRTREHAPC